MGLSEISSVYHSILLLMSFSFFVRLFYSSSSLIIKKCCKENSCSNVMVHMYKSFFKTVVLNPGYIMKSPKEALKIILISGFHPQRF